MEYKNIKHPFDIADLIAGYLQSALSEPQKEKLFEWVAQSEDNRKLFSEILNEQNLEQHLTEFAAYDARAALIKFKSKRGTVKILTRPALPWMRISVAASLLLMFSFGFWLYQKHRYLAEPIVQNKNDIAPGSNKAILILANGQKITLTDAKNGLIARQGGANVAKKENGQLVYSRDDQATSPNEAGVLMNTVQTPRGGKYVLTLADGTIAILDAASSIRYPVAFNGKERLVEITGQVYFEVVHNAAQPFRVVVKGQTVEDLGTKFNINAYDNEPVIKTTLLEGSISLKKANRVIILKPGEQAISSITDAAVKVGTADTEEAIAWKNDYFIFNNESLESVMRKISRWYDVDIQYQSGQRISETYLGSMTRYTNVSQVLKMLEITGDVKFKVEGKTIIVYKKSINRIFNN